MATIDPVIVKIQADVADLKTGLEKAEVSLKGLDDNVKNTTNGFAAFTDRMKQLGAVIGVTFAASQIVSFFKESVAAAQEAEAAQNRLATLLRNTNGATEEQIVALNNQAKALEAIGVVSADNVTIAQSQLATFDLSAAAIGKLTPAILNYVTAEKGASASADDFRQMTNGLAQALNGQFGSLTRLGFTLTETDKQMISSGTEMERAAALTKILNSTYDGFNESLRNTSEGLRQVALNDLNNLKQQIGEGLQPVIDGFTRFLTDTLLPALSKLTKFLIDNKDTIIAVTKVLAGGAAAFALYKTAITVATTATKVYEVAMILMKGQQLATIASTNTLAASMLRLNAVIRANPIGALITVVTLAVAAIVALWKNSDKFRSMVITAGKAGLQAFAAIVPMVAQVYEVILKVATGPLRLLLEALSRLPGVGKYAKAGLDILKTGLNSISDFGVKAANKAKELSASLDNLANKAKKAGKDTKDALDSINFGKGKTGGTTDNKAVKKAQTDLEKLQEKYNELAEEMSEALTEELKTLEEKRAEAQERYNERVIDLNKEYKDRLLDLEENYNDDVLSAYKKYDKSVIEARTNTAKRIIDINKEFAKKEKDLREKFIEQQRNLEIEAQNKRLEARQKASEKEQSLIQNSIDRLRSAFASALGFNLKDEFEKSGGVTGLLESLRNRLTAAKQLQENAATLAGKGYSQTFIEQIVEAGPTIGNELANSLLQATPETAKELQTLFGQIETLSDTGLNNLAETMNQGGNLATKELRDAYANVAKDLITSYAEIDKQLKESLAEAQSSYEKAIVDAAKSRDEAILEANEALAEALLELKNNLNESLIELLEELKKAQIKAQKELQKGLAEAQESLQKTLTDAQKAYEKAVSKIYDKYMDQLNKLQDAIEKTKNELTALNAPVPNVTLTTLPVNPVTSTSTGTVTNTTNNNIEVAAITNADPSTIANTMIYALKYGQVIQVAPGTVTTGKYADSGTMYFK